MTTLVERVCHEQGAVCLIVNWLRVTDIVCVRSGTGHTITPIYLCLAFNIASIPVLQGDKPQYQGLDVSRYGRVLACI